MGWKVRWGRDFPHLSTPAIGPTQPSMKWVSESLYARGVALPTYPHLALRLKKEYNSTSPSGIHWVKFWVFGRTGNGRICVLLVLLFSV